MILRLRTKRTLFFIYLVFLPITFSAYSRLPLSTATLGNFPMTSSPENGVSNYVITQNVKYEVEINLSLTHKSLANSTYWFKFARLNDKQPNSSITQFSPPYQESELVFSNITGFNNTPYVMQDKFDNTYDVFNNTLNYNEEILLNQIYNITLNEVVFQDIVGAGGIYNTSDDIFDLYCNNSVLYYEINNTALINKSNEIVVGITDPVLKAEAIYNWVSGHLEYDGNLPDQEMGALWAYNNEKGDCSEYSSLMVTMLRIQNIPARKVTGFVISNNPATRPQVGDKWDFSISRNDGIVTSDFLGHAWVEYYVPEIGWIASDPTWNAANYFNKNDYLRFHLNVGQWFSIPEVVNDSSEFPNPCIVYNQLATFDYLYEAQITVIESNLIPLEEFPFLFVIFIGVGVAAVLFTIILIIMKRRKKNYYD